MAQFPAEPPSQQLAEIARALASAVRLRLLDALGRREYTAEQLSRQSGIPLKNASAQLRHLRKASLVIGRRSGPRLYYRVADERVLRFLAQLRDFTDERRAGP